MATRSLGTTIRAIANRDVVIQRLPGLLRPHQVVVPSPTNAEVVKLRPVLSTYLATRRTSRGRSSEFDHVRYFTFFVGWPRSGHSLFGALLDAHQAFAIAHEVDALRLVDAGFSRTQLFSAIVDNARAFAESPGGRGWSGYSYAVPGQWQGRHETVRVIGDKKGGLSSYYIARVNPRIIDRVRSCVRVPLKVIVYHRNPFDILATITRRMGLTSVPATVVADTLDDLVMAVAQVRQSADSTEILELYHEDVVGDPGRTLKSTIDAFGETASPEYLEAAVAIVEPSPRRTRDTINWDPEVVQLVEDRISESPELRRYSFDS